MSSHFWECTVARCYKFLMFLILSLSLLRLRLTLILSFSFLDSPFFSLSSFSLSLSLVDWLVPRSRYGGLLVRFEWLGSGSWVWWGCGTDGIVGRWLWVWWGCGSMVVRCGSDRIVGRGNGSWVWWGCGLMVVGRGSMVVGLIGLWVWWGCLWL